MKEVLRRNQEVFLFMLVITCLLFLIISRVNNLNASNYVKLSQTIAINN